MMRESAVEGNEMEQITRKGPPAAIRLLLHQAEGMTR
jgi:hypothetical protein